MRPELKPRRFARDQACTERVPPYSTPSHDPELEVICNRTKPFRSHFLWKPIVLEVVLRCVVVEVELLLCVEREPLVGIAPQQKFVRFRLACSKILCVCVLNDTQKPETAEEF